MANSDEGVRILQAYALGQVLCALLDKVTHNLKVQHRILQEADEYIVRHPHFYHDYFSRKATEDRKRAALELIASGGFPSFRVPTHPEKDRKERHRTLKAATLTYEKLRDCLKQKVRVAKHEQSREYSKQRVRDIASALQEALSSRDVQKLRGYLEGWKEVSREEIALEATAHLHNREPGYLERHLPRKQQVNIFDFMAREEDPVPYRILGLLRTLGFLPDEETTCHLSEALIKARAEKKKKDTDHASLRTHVADHAGAIRIAEIETAV